MHIHIFTQIFAFIYMYTSQVESYQRLKNWYVIPYCLTLSIIRYIFKGKVEQSKEGSSVFPYTVL